MGGKVGLICGSCWSGKYTSGSGSVIGRDPLPPRAVSTSHLAERTLTQPPPVETTLSSTLPLPRTSGGHRQQQQQHLPIHRSSPQQQQLQQQQHLDSQILRASSNGDIGTNVGQTNNNEMKDLKVSSPGSHQAQRLHGSTGHLRVIGLNDHRISSPSENEIQVHSPIERKVISPIGMLDTHRNVVGGNMRGNQRVRESAELQHIKARLAEFDIPRRLENLQRLEELKNHLMDLEKQYEKGKPLVNLVDNMVKLGSLYNRNAINGSTGVTASRHDLFQENSKNHRDRLEFNQRVQEQRLLAEERRDWDRLSPDHGQLQAKVQQLYKLDRLLQEESGTLHSLQQDKEILEKALGGLRHKLQGSRSNLVEAERYRKQQLLLERELSRVRVLLAHNSKVSRYSVRNWKRP